MGEKETASAVRELVDGQAGSVLDARQVIERFGGIRPMASKLDLTASTVQGWSERNSIPAPRREAVLRAAREQGLGIVPRDLGSPPCAPASPGKLMGQAPGSGVRDTSRALRPGMAAADWDGADGDGAYWDRADRDGPEREKTLASPTNAGAAVGGSLWDEKTDSDDKAGKDGSAMNQESKGPKDNTPKAKEEARENSQGAAASENGKSADGKPSEPKAKELAKESGKESAKSAAEASAGAKSSGKAQSGAGSSGKSPSEKSAARTSAASKSAASGIGLPASGSKAGSGGSGGAPSGSASSGTAKSDRAAASAAKPKPGRGAFYGGLLVGILLLAGGFVAALASRDYWQPLFGAPAAPDEALLERFQSLDGRLSALERAPEPIVDLSALEDRLVALENRTSADPDALRADIDGLRRELGAEIETLKALGGGGSAESEAARAALAEELAALRAELSALSQMEDSLADLASAQEATQAALVASGSGTSGDAALILAILQLRSALTGSGAYAQEMRLLKDLAAREDAPEVADMISPLAPHAESGLPSLADLRASFPETARSIIAEGAGGAEENIWSGVKRSLSRIVTIRPLEPDAADTSPGSLVAQAEAALEAGDLAGALAALEQLDGRAADAAAGWQQRAAQRQEAQDILTKLGDYVIARIGS